MKSAKVSFTVGSQSCREFENYATISGFGNTSGADAGEQNVTPDFSAYPSLLLSADQETFQFASAKAASTFYGQVYAKYNACSDLNETYIDGSTEELANQSMTKITVGKYQAFSLLQSDTLSGVSNTFYASTTVVVAGTNVYLIDELSGTTDPVSPDLLSKLITRTQALYPRH